VFHGRSVGHNVQFCSIKPHGMCLLDLLALPFFKTEIGRTVGMMMMSRFLERVINGPQTRCRSAEQVPLQMSSERQGGRVAVRRAAGKLFQMTGPATAKLLIHSVVLVLGTDSVPVPADCRCRLPSTSAPIRVGTCKLLSPDST